MAEDRGIVIEALLQRGRPWENHKDRLIRTLQNFKFSEAFHWTPKQITELSEDQREEYLLILMGMSKAKPPKVK